MIFQDAIQDYTGQPLTRQILLDLLSEYKRPYDKLNELVKQNKLVPVKRGIYVPGPRLNIAGPEPFLIANHLSGPSYISLETALSHWGLIPERVHEISSVTMGNSRIYNTPIGRFSYTHLPLPYYSFGIKQVELTQKQTALVAGPEKALCDKIVTTSGVLLRSAKQVMAFLTEDLRIEKEILRNLNYKEIEKWMSDTPKKASIQLLVQTLKKL